MLLEHLEHGEVFGQFAGVSELAFHLTSAHSTEIVDVKQSSLQEWFLSTRTYDSSGQMNVSSPASPEFIVSVDRSSES